MDKDDQDMMDFLNDEIDSLKEKLTAAAERERVLVKALEFYVEDDECKYGPSEGGTHPYCEDDEACRWCKANQALAQVKGEIDYCKCSNVGPGAIEPDMPVYGDGTCTYCHKIVNR